MLAYPEVQFVWQDTTIYNKYTAYHQDTGSTGRIVISCTPSGKSMSVQQSRQNPSSQALSANEILNDQCTQSFLCCAELDRGLQRRGASIYSALHAKFVTGNRQYLWTRRWAGADSEHAGLCYILRKDHALGVIQLKASAHTRFHHT